MFILVLRYKYFNVTNGVNSKDGPVVAQVWSRDNKWLHTG